MMFGKYAPVYAREQTSNSTHILAFRPYTDIYWQTDKCAMQIYPYTDKSHIPEHFTKRYFRKTSWIDIYTDKGNFSMTQNLLVQILSKTFSQECFIGVENTADSHARHQGILNFWYCWTQHYMNQKARVDESVLWRKNYCSISHYYFPSMKIIETLSDGLFETRHLHA